MKKLTTREIAIMGILIAIHVFLGRYLALNIGSFIRINFSFVATAITASFFGPLWTAIACGISDIIGATLFPTGSFFPGLTFSAMVSGYIYGIFLYRKHFSWWRVILVRVCHTVVVSFGLNTLFLSILYGNSFIAVLYTRVATNLATLPIYIILLGLVSQYLIPQLKRQMLMQN